MGYYTLPIQQEELIASHEGSSHQRNISAVTHSSSAPHAANQLTNQPILNPHCFLFSYGKDKEEELKKSGAENVKTLVCLELKQIFMITQLTSAMGKQKQPQTTYNIHIYDIKLRYYKRETQNANMVSKSGIETRTLYARGMLNII